MLNLNDLTHEEKEALAEDCEDLIEMSIEELIEETSTGEGYTLDEWMENWGQ